MTPDDLIFDQDAVDRASVDFDWAAVEEDMRVASSCIDLETLALTLRSIMTHLMDVERIPRNLRLRALGMRLLAIAAVTSPDIVRPNANLQEIAAHFGVTPDALSQRMTASQANQPGVRRRKVRRYAPVRLTRKPQ
jgi:hypothetical protein